AVGGLFLGACVVALIWPNEGLGIAPAVAALSLAIILCILALIAFLADHVRLPLLGAIGVLLLVASWYGWDDHHVVRSRPLVSPPPGVNKAFADWLADRSQGAGATPVVIVAAEGGGIRAAVMTAMVLDELRARAPRFSQSLFAVVGVSGGSVGAAAYSVALHQHRPQVRLAAIQRDPAASGWQNSLGADLLSPTVRSMLGLDLLSRFVPNWLSDRTAWSRAGALEGAW